MNAKKLNKWKYCKFMHFFVHVFAHVQTLHVKTEFGGNVVFKWTLVGRVPAAVCMCAEEKEVKIRGKNNHEWVKNIKLCVRDREKLCARIECVPTNYLRDGLVSCVEWQHCNENVGIEKIQELMLYRRSGCWVFLVVSLSQLYPV